MANREHDEQHHGREPACEHEGLDDPAAERGVACAAIVSVHGGVHRTSLRPPSGPLNPHTRHRTNLSTMPPISISSPVATAKVRRWHFGQASFGSDAFGRAFGNLAMLTIR